MFEAEQKEQESSSKLWIGVAIVASAVVVGAVYYMSRQSATPRAPAAASSAAPAAGPVQTDPDPVHDLKIQRATMDKDRTGTTAVWLVAIENKSAVFTYSDIQYETSYIGADNRPLLVNTGKIPIRLGPHEQLSREIRDALYPTGTAWFKFKITGATSAKQ